MRKTKAEAQKTRQYLLNAALEVFYRTGVTRSSLQAVAQEAGVTRGALYWHFKNKEDLFEALFEQHFAIFLSLLNDDTLHAGQNALTQLRDGLHQFFILLDSDEQQKKFCIVMHLKCEQTEVNKTITQLSERYHQMCRIQIEHALQLSQSQGKLPPHLDITQAALYLENSLVGLINIWIRDPNRFRLPEIAAHIIDTNLSVLEQGLF